MSRSSVLRNTWNRYVNENPCVITVWIKPTTDNGYGETIPDLTQAGVETVLGTARVARRRLPDPIVTNARTPYDYLDSYYLLATYDSDWLKKGLVFAYNGEKFRTLLVESRVAFGDVIYKICNLEQVTSRSVSS